jgi:hypothetical protein
MFNKKNIEYLWLVALILFPFVLWILPSDFFDNDGFVICPSRLFFNIECFGCGMTRAVMHCHHLEFDDAVYYNRASLIVYPALIVIWFRWVFASIKKVRGYREAENPSQGTL